MSASDRAILLAALASFTTSGCWLLESRSTRRSDAGAIGRADAGTIGPADAGTVGPADAGTRASDGSTAASDARAADAGAPDARPACRFVAAGFRGGETIECSVSADSTSACTEAAICLCAAADITDEVELLQCVGSELTPRGAITFADYCTESPPARVDLGEALRGYLAGRGAGDLPISRECDDIPALVGPEPWEACFRLASAVCQCSDGDCPFDRIVGARCVSLARESVDCILAQLPGELDEICASLDRVDDWRRACGG